MDPDVKKPNILGEINTFLFDANIEKRTKDNDKNGKMSIFFTKDLGNGKHRTISLVKEEEDDIKNPENNNNQRKNAHKHQSKESREVHRAKRIIFHVRAFIPH